jgi:acyl transferase domain-containing protein
VSLIRKINEKYKTSIEATKIYSYPTVAQLSRYVKEETEKHGDFQATIATEIINRVLPQNVVQSNGHFALKQDARKLTSWRNNSPSRKISEADSSLKAQPIAVIGMAGQFPQANNIEEFWQNIANAKNCISEISPKRWDVDTYYQEGTPNEGKTNSKWLGALEGYSLFDPHFFTISPKEAESMDPQQRLFLQTCWHTMEDAGYNAQSLSGSKCGVFVGCTVSDYQLLARELQLSAQGFTGSAPSILAARISYFLNLQGPCVSIDTACSSSLVAIANACESLITGASDMALAGGVYVMAGPELHVKTAQSGMLSQDGKCYTFDQRANGFVPGEGVGVVMLKRLADAERDQDTIYGVIQGWGVNQDGKTNGITAPNAESQTRLEQEVYDKFGIDPNQIQLVEAHGTGTKLGDPIEVDALKQSFKKYTQKKEYCALGSVKSNIGHCLTAAGVASFIKVLMSLEHKKLPPTINYENLNEHINLKDSPFYVNIQLNDWTVESNQIRQAAISAFGFSGTNAHIVVAEYRKPVSAKKAIPVITQNGKMMVPLSARNTVQLKEKAQDLLNFLRKNEGSIDLLNVAYTLQVAREAMEERLGFMVGSIHELIEKLSAYNEGDENVESVFQGQVKRNKEGLKLLVQDEEMKETIVGKWISERKLAKLLDLWVKGLEFNWNKLYSEVKPERVHLPVYPFAKEHYWIEAQDTVHQSVSVVSDSDILHPLLHKKVEDITEQGYTHNVLETDSLSPGKQKIQLINLPTYPFARERYWPEKSPSTMVNSDLTNGMSINLDFIEDIIHKVDNDSMEVDDAVNLLKTAL